MLEPMGARLFVRPLEESGHGTVVAIGALVGWSKGEHTALDADGAPLGSPRLGDDVVYAAAFTQVKVTTDGVEETLHVLDETDVVARVTTVERRVAEAAASVGLEDRDPGEADPPGSPYDRPQDDADPDTAPHAGD